MICARTRLPTRRHPCPHKRPSSLRRRTSLPRGQPRGPPGSCSPCRQDRPSRNASPFAIRTPRGAIPGSSLGDGQGRCDIPASGEINTTFMRANGTSQWRCQVIVSSGVFKGHPCGVLGCRTLRGSIMPSSQTWEGQGGSTGPTFATLGFPRPNPVISVLEAACPGSSAISTHFWRTHHSPEKPAGAL